MDRFGIYQSLVKYGLNFNSRHIVVPLTLSSLKKQTKVINWNISSPILNIIDSSIHYSTLMGHFFVLYPMSTNDLLFNIVCSDQIRIITIYGLSVISPLASVAQKT